MVKACNVSTLICQFAWLCLSDSFEKFTIMEIKKNKCHLRIYKYIYGESFKAKPILKFLLKLVGFVKMLRLIKALQSALQKFPDYFWARLVGICQKIGGGLANISKRTATHLMESEVRSYSI